MQVIKQVAASETDGSRRVQGSAVSADSAWGPRRRPASGSSSLPP